VPVCDLAPILHGLGLSRHTIEPAPTPALDASTTLGPAPSEPPLALARRLGLTIYTYTFADEPDALARFFHTHQVDALFTDNPDVALRARDAH
jgi:glycerophosphoryl diester phosphodiesterase